MSSVAEVTERITLSAGEPGLNEPGLPGRVARWSRNLARVELAIVGVVFTAMLLAMLVQVFTRYVLNDPLTGTGEISRYLYVWATFLGASAGISYRQEIKVDVLHVLLRPVERRRPEAARSAGRWADALGATVALGFVLSLGWLAFEYTSYQFEGGATSTSLSLPMWIPTAALPVALTLSGFHYIAELVVALTRGRTAPTAARESA